ncbi:MAG: hypothetical protein RL264_649 [Bacteroidota bacterium]|jgi:hypothetical protein
MKNLNLLITLLLGFGLNAQVDNTMYGLQQTTNPAGFKLATMNPLTGQVTVISNSVLSTMVNVTGSSLNPYNQTFSFQDEDSWLTVSLQTGEVLNDVSVSFPNSNGNFNNFRFNTADSIMYGLYTVTFSNPMNGTVGDMRLAKCDLSTGIVSLISPSSIAENYTATGNTIDPYQMLYYFQSEGKFIGLDLYNGQIYSQPNITIIGEGTSFHNIAYSCVDTTIYGLIMQNGVKALGKINPQTGVVTALSTQLSFDNLVFNAGGAIDPVNRVYYFQTIDNNQTKFVGLSLIDGSVVSETNLSSNGDYFTMYRIQSDCYEANPTRLNSTSNLPEIKNLSINIYPNPAQEVLNLNATSNLTQVEIIDACGNFVNHFYPNQTQFQLPIETLAPGIYYLKISTADSNVTERFVKN